MSEENRKTAICKNCGEPIELRSYQVGRVWVWDHIDTGDDMCDLYAEPKENDEN